jgi:hypothetical protein
LWRGSGADLPQIAVVASPKRRRREFREFREFDFLSKAANNEFDALKFAESCLSMTCLNLCETGCFT